MEKNLAIYYGVVGILAVALLASLVLIGLSLWKLNDGGGWGASSLWIKVTGFWLATWLLLWMIDIALIIETWGEYDYSGSGSDKKAEMTDNTVKAYFHISGIYTFVSSVTYCLVLFLQIDLIRTLKAVSSSGGFRIAALLIGLVVVLVSVIRFICFELTIHYNYVALFVYNMMDLVISFIFVVSAFGSLAYFATANGSTVRSVFAPVAVLNALTIARHLDEFVTFILTIIAIFKDDVGSQVQYQLIKSMLSGWTTVISLGLIAHLCYQDMSHEWNILTGEKM